MFMNDVTEGYMDRNALERLLNDMSTEEKVMQLVQIPGSEYEADAEITGVERGQVKDNVKRLAGSTLGIWGSGRLKKIQERYMKEHPHHIPLMFMLDVIHGHKTVLPCPLGQSNPEKEYEECPDCKSTNIRKLNANNRRGKMSNDTCSCPNCGYSEPKIRGHRLRKSGKRIQVNCL